MQTAAKFTEHEQSHACQVSVYEGNINIYFDNKELPMQIWSLRSVTQTWDNGTFVIRHPHHPAAALHCPAGFATEVEQHLKQPPKKAKRKFTSAHAFILAIPVLIVAGIIGIYFLLIPWLSGIAAKAIPVHTEISLGESMSSQYISQSLKNDSVTFHANRFFAALNAGSAYPVKIHVIRSAELNAFAVPGGNIFVYTGLLEKMKTPEELAALLGHEVTHVNNRHSLKAICRQATGALIFASIFGDVADLGTWVISKADDLRQLDYSRSLETESDDDGFQLMVRNRIDPNGMVRLLETLKAQNEQSPGLMRYLSTHPETDSRIANIKKQITADMKWPCPAVLATHFALLRRHTQ